MASAFSLMPSASLWYLACMILASAAPLLSMTLAATRGNQVKAAQLLGLNRNTLRKKIRDLDVQVVRGLR